MKIVAIIQVRMNSTRLPRKALMDVAGMPMIDRVILRALAIPRVSDVVLNCPAEDEELHIRPWCKSIPVPFQERDVLGSYYKIALKEKADVVIRLTGDCPLLAPDAAGMVLERYLCGDLDYVANVGTVAGERTYTQWFDGTDTEVFGIEVLEDAYRHAISPYHRQHVTTYVRMQSQWRRGYVPSPEDYSALKCSVDTEEDAQRVEAILRQKPDGMGYQSTWDAWNEAGRP